MHLSGLISRVEKGEDVVIVKAGNAVARLVPALNPGEKRVLGYDKGLPFIMASDFDTFVPDKFGENFK